MESTQPQAVQAAEPQAQKIKVKFNHEEKEIPLDEAITHSQKGMNYDHVYEELQSLRNDEGLKLLDQTAKERGISRQELAKQWKSELTDRKVTEYAEKHEVSPEVAKELLEAKVERDRIKEELAIERAEKEKAKVLDNQIKDFFNTFPDVTTVPDEVLEICKEQGVPLKVAYKAYQAEILERKIKEMEEQSSVKKVNDTNASSSMGSAVSMGDTSPQEYTYESIKKMAPDEMEKHIPAILQAMKEGRVK
jgi:hypothetical protein